MTSWKSKCAVLAVTGLLSTAVCVSAAMPANAQASVVVGVAFENLTNGTTVDCPFEDPQSGGVVAGVVECSVTAHAEGGQIANHCREGASVRVDPVDVGAGSSGCSVVVGGTITVAYEGTGSSTGDVYTCGGAGLGTATYSPSAQSVASSMTGPVLLSYDDGVLTVEGAMFNLGSVNVGHISAEGLDPCGGDNLAHPFAGVIS